MCDKVEMEKILCYFVSRCFFCIGLVIGSVVKTEINVPKLLVISFDGFRWDYLDMVKASGRRTPNFDALIQDGSKAKWMKSTYTSITFPNHYTIATGLYEENHGVIGNKMYDPVFEEEFTGANGQTRESKWWDNGTQTWQGEPIWLTNQQKAGHRSGVYYWIGSEAAIRGQRPYHYTHYNWSMPYHTRVDTVVNWLTDDVHPVNFAMLYFEEPDHTGHQQGPNSQAILDKVVEMDTLLGYIIQTLEHKQLLPGIDIIVTSDHGMAEMTNTVYLEDYVDSQLYQAYGETPVLQIQPNKDQGSEVYQSLLEVPNVRVYRKESMPPEYHYRYNRRIMSIVVEAEEGHILCKSRQKCVIRKGDHGYNNSHPNMHPIFMALGPSFKRGFLSEPFNNVDIYPLMCHLLGVKPAQHDGNLQNIKQILHEEESLAVDSHSEEVIKMGTDLTAVGIVVGILLLFFGVYCLLMFLSRRRQHATDMDSSTPLLRDHTASA